jgi:hypothetical protein
MVALSRQWMKASFERVQTAAPVYQAGTALLECGAQHALRGACYGILSDCQFCYGPPPSFRLDICSAKEQFPSWQVL